MKIPKKMPCPKVGRPLAVISLEPGILSAFCHFCSAWHNWTRKDLVKTDKKN